MEVTGNVLACGFNAAIAGFAAQRSGEDGAGFIDVAGA